MFDIFDVRNAKADEPIRAPAYAPYNKDIPKIKSVIVSEHEDPNWTWYKADGYETFLASL